MGKLPMRRTLLTAPSFIPRNLAPDMLYDSDHVIQSAGTVSQLTDLGTAGVNLVQATGANQPTYNTGGFNGRPYLGFTGTQWLQSAGNIGTFANAAGITIFVVGAMGTNDSNKAVFVINGTNTTGTFFFGKNGGSPYAYWLQFLSSGPATASLGNYSAMANVGILEGYYDGANNTILRNGTQAATTAATGLIPNQTTSPLTVGRTSNAAFNLTGTIYAVAIFARALNTDQRRRMRAYYTTYYGLAGAP